MSVLSPDERSLIRCVVDAVRPPDLPLGTDDIAAKFVKTVASERTGRTRYSPDCVPRPPVVKYIAPSGPNVRSVTLSGSSSK